MAKKYLTRAELCDYLKISEERRIVLTKEHGLPSGERLCGSRMLYIRLEDLERWIEENLAA